jgi:DNA repair exonuclease SbcCD ATPase subunit
MTEAREKIDAGLAEALAFANGAHPAARIHVNGHEYVPAVELVTANMQIKKLHARLEMDHAFVMDDLTTGELRRIEIEPGIIPDGIECRDDTIRLQDEQIERLVTERVALIHDLESANRSVLAETEARAAAEAERDALKAENERLRAAVAELTEENKNVGAQMDSFADEIEWLRRVLEPFDDALGEDDTGLAAETKIILRYGPVTEYSLTLGDFRHARAALNKEGG